MYLFFVLYAVDHSFVFFLNFLHNCFAEAFHRSIPKWRVFSSSSSSWQAVFLVALFIQTTSEQKSPIFHQKRCASMPFVSGSLIITIITRDVFVFRWRHHFQILFYSKFMRCVTLNVSPRIALFKRAAIAYVFANWTVLAIDEVLLSIYQNSKVIIFPFNGKTRWQMLLLLYGHHVGAPWNDTNMASPYKVLSI